MPAGTSDEFPYVLSTIQDRNGNTVSLTYETAEKEGFKRLKTITGTAGRTLTLEYYSGTDLIYSVMDPLNRQVFFYFDVFTNDGQANLIRFKDAEALITTYSYGDNEDNDCRKHLLLFVKLPKGNSITNEYQYKKLVSTQNGSSKPTTFSYERNYSQTSLNNYVKTTITHPDDEQTVIEYNKNGLATSASGPGSNASVIYDAAHPTKPLSVTQNNKTAQYQYDDNGNVIQVDLPLDITHRFQYTALNDPEYYTDPRGKVYTFGYDTKGNLKSVTTPRGTTQYTVDSRGLLVSMTNPEGIYVSYGYDAYGNVNRITAPEGITIQGSYDSASRIKSMTNPNSQTVSYTYDANDNTLSETFVHNTGFGYDANENLTGVTNAKGGVTQLDYSQEDDLLTSVEFMGYRDRYSYYDNGQLKTYTDPNNRTFTFTYDNDNRLTNDGYATYTYYSDNSIKTVTRNNKTLTYAYDALGRIISTVYDGRTVAYEYDKAGNLIKMIYPGGKTVEYTYYDDNLLHTVEDWNFAVTTYSYRSDGLLEQVQYPNGMTTTYNYDGAGRVTELITSKSDEILVAYNYTLDTMGNHTC